MENNKIINEYVDLIYKYRDDVPFLKNHDMNTKEKIKDYLTKDVSGITSAVIAYSFEHNLRNLLKYDDYKNFAINYGLHDLDIINEAQKKEVADTNKKDNELDVFDMNYKKNNNKGKGV